MSDAAARHAVAVRLRYDRFVNELTALGQVPPPFDVLLEEYRNHPRFTIIETMDYRTRKAMYQAGLTRT